MIIDRSSDPFIWIILQNCYIFTFIILSAIFYLIRYCLYVNGCSLHDDLVVIQFNLRSKYNILTTILWSEISLNSEHRTSCMTIIGHLLFIDINIIYRKSLAPFLKRQWNRATLTANLVPSCFKILHILWIISVSDPI